MAPETDRNHPPQISMAPETDQNHSAKLSRARNHSTTTSMDKNNSAIISLGSDRDKNHSKGVGGKKNSVKCLGDSMQSGRMKSQSSTGTGSSSASSGSCNFQFFVQSDDGLSLSVDLNSYPLDWIRACSDGIKVPQHLHKPKKATLRSNSSSSSVVGSVTPGGFVDSGVLFAEKGLQCNGFGFGFGVEDVDGSEKKRAEIDESASGCIEERAMGELCASQPEVFQNIVLRREKDSEGRELTDYGFQHGVSDQGALVACNQKPAVQCDHSKEAFQNKDGEISRNFRMGIPVEGTTQEQDCNQSMVDNLQDKSQMHKDEVKKAPVVKNLRKLKNLARGPIVVQDNAKSRRKSARFSKEP